MIFGGALSGGYPLAWRWESALRFGAVKEGKRGNGRHEAAGRGFFAMILIRFEECKPHKQSVLADESRKQRGGRVEGSQAGRLCHWGY